MKKGLVLEGGAMRGLFTAGVIDVMMERGLRPDGIIGVSAGAAFGCNYKSHQPGRCIRYNTRFANDWRYCSLRSWIRTGDLFGGRFCYHELPRHLDRFDEAAFEADPMAFYVVCTDVWTGRAVYQQVSRCTEEDYEWFRASASMPLVSRVVNIGVRQLLDGGISDSIPLAYFQQLGFDRNIVVETQPADYVKRRSRLLPLMRIGLRRYPELLRAMCSRPDMYNAQKAYVRQEEQAGRALVIRPDKPLPIGHISKDPAEMRRVYEIGRQMGLRRIEEIEQFMNDGVTKQ